MMKTHTLQRLPLGLSTFSKIRNDGYLYVDKTEHAHNLITQGDRYFLSRPRRFGKSLLVSTLKEILEGNKHLFKDLWIEKSDYAWHKYGVIALDFSGLGIKNIETLTSGLLYAFSRIAQNYELTEPIHATSPELALRDIAIALHNRFGKVAILIDEYDNPILSLLHDQEKAKEVRDSLKYFFAAIKSLDEYINFVFITGVSAFAKAGIFSGLNNLKIITLDNRWDTICGYTDQEIDHYFALHIQAWADQQNSSYDELRAHIKDWYNGYRFGADATSVYNPFSFMNALDEKKFKNFWFATGTPSFLVKELEKAYRSSEIRLLDLESIETTTDVLETFEVGKTPLSALMFQTGYLTITHFDKDNQSYRLGYPNYEVRTAAQKYLLGIYTNVDFETTDQFSLKLVNSLKKRLFLK